ncbi:MAG: hypothetical protein GTO22_16070 [Gemmatimonadales bacterium]|nr:hypothetical protein [Gemmatimonadales bacterium]
MTPRWKGLAVAAVILGASGCANNYEWVSEDVHPLGPTLQIVNNTSLAYRVTVGTGVVVQSHPGQTNCVRVGNLNEVRIMEVFALASSVAYHTPPENLMNAPGWILEIGQQPKYDVLSLRPAEPCMR